MIRSALSKMVSIAFQAFSTMVWIPRKLLSHSIVMRSSAAEIISPMLVKISDVYSLMLPKSVTHAAVRAVTSPITTPRGPASSPIMAAKPPVPPIRPIMAEMEEANLPKISSIGPIAATIILNVRITCLVSSSMALRLSTNSVRWRIPSVRVGTSISPKEIARPSKAEPRMVSWPPRLSSMVSAMSWAVPSAVLMAFVSLLKSVSLALTIANRPDIPSLPARLAATSACSAWLSWLKPFLRSTMTSFRDFMLPSLSVRETFSLLIAQSILSVGLTMLVSRVLSAVPAWEALIPLLAMRPRATDVSSTLYPREPATGATYLKDSPNIDTLVLALLDAAASTSAKWAESWAWRPNAVSASVTMSDVRARSSPDAAARFIMPSIPLSISSVFQPAIAM